MIDGEYKQTYISEALLMEAVKEAAEKQIQLLGTLRSQWMRQVRPAGNNKKQRSAGHGNQGGNGRRNPAH